MTKRVKKTKEETSKDIWNAIELIKAGVADKLDQPSCKIISIKNVCIQANISRPTLYSYPKIKEYIDENSVKKSKDYLKRIGELEEENQELRDYIKRIEEERDSALLEQFNSNEKLKNKDNVVNLK